LTSALRVSPLFFFLVWKPAATNKQQTYEPGRETGEKMKQQQFIQAAVLLLVLFQLVSVATANWSLLGIFNKNQPNETNTVALDRFTGKQHTVQLVFITFDASENTWLWNVLKNIWAGGRVPIISWQPLFVAGTPK